MTDTIEQPVTSESTDLKSDKNNNTTKQEPQETQVKAIENGENEAETNSNEDDAVKDENELILIQDNAFTVKIQVPGLDAFDLQVTSMELVQEIHQMLMDKEETCHRTCFSLQLDGNTLDNFSELKAIEGIKEGSVIKLVEGLFFFKQN